MKKWNTTKLIAAGAMSVLLTLTILLEIPLTVLSGIPGLGGVVGAFFEVVVFTLGILIIQKFGTGTIIGTITGFLILPLPVFGPPGFIIKVVMGFIVGFMFDIIYLFFKKYKKWGIIISNILLIIIFMIVFNIVVTFLKLPGFGYSFNLFIIFTSVFIIEATAGSFVGWYIYKKLEKTTIIKRIQK